MDLFTCTGNFSCDLAIASLGSNEPGCRSCDATLRRVSALKVSQPSLSAVFCARSSASPSCNCLPRLQVQRMTRQFFDLRHVLDHCCLTLCSARSTKLPNWSDHAANCRGLEGNVAGYPMPLTSTNVTRVICADNSCAGKCTMRCKSATRGTSSPRTACCCCSVW